MVLLQNNVIDNSSKMEELWKRDESDEEYEDEYDHNEVAPPEIDNNFRENVLNIKHLLYENSVLSPELGTEKAQSVEALQDYLQNINHIYVLSLNAQKGLMNKDDLSKFPENVREPIKLLLNWLSDYFSKNRVPDTIPYEDYIRKSFREYQFVQDNSFE
jgi:hypothetical protein